MLKTTYFQANPPQISIFQAKPSPSANSNSINKSNHNPPILDQNVNSIRILKQYANFCSISYQWALNVIPILDQSATPMQIPDQSTNPYPIQKSNAKPLRICQFITHTHVLIGKSIANPPIHCKFSNPSNPPILDQYPKLWPIFGQSDKPMPLLRKSQTSVGPNPMPIWKDLIFKLNTKCY